jgi:hypothetical protein
VAPTLFLRFALVNLRYKPLWNGMGVSVSNPVACTSRWCKVEFCRPPRKEITATAFGDATPPDRSSLITVLGQRMA